MEPIRPYEFFDFFRYQWMARDTAVYPQGVWYPLIGLMGETGEVAEKIKKHIRDGTPLDKEDLKKELGDVLWYVSNLATDLGISLDDIAYTNLKKVADRQARGVTHGSGDNR